MDDNFAMGLDEYKRMRAELEQLRNDRDHWRKNAQRYLAMAGEYQEKIERLMQRLHELEDEIDQCHKGKE
jgi:uncharacterized coiled-coil DUF342 family protein